jgi:hypothetical protein
MTLPVTALQRSIAEEFASIWDDSHWGREEMWRTIYNFEEINQDFLRIVDMF